MAGEWRGAFRAAGGSWCFPLCAPGALLLDGAVRGIAAMLMGLFTCQLRLVPDCSQVLPPCFHFSCVFLFCRQIGTAQGPPGDVLPAPAQAAPAPCSADPKSVWG